ncbi:MAG: serine protease [bacterium]|nr:serine protease [bacterium]
MSPHIKAFLANVGAIGIIVGVFVVLTHPQWVGFESSLNGGGETISTLSEVGAPADADQSASASSAVSATTSEANPVSPTVKTAPVKQQEQAVPIPSPSATSTSDNFQAIRIENPYQFPPQELAIINDETRLALVNILCAARSGSLRPISASGVIIDSRGVILTNAHVAQYVLLASDQQVDLSCVIRTGSPAIARFIPEILYIPPAWIYEHARDIKTTRPEGTGEHDYALLRIKGTVNGSPLPETFPSLPIDSRETIGFVDDSVLVASYPAEFIGGATTQLNLYPATSVTTIKNLLTFSDTGTVDLVSVGGVIEAQSGSSGGAIVNAWGRLIGLISTTSEGLTTSVRDLRAITLSYINRDISIQSGLDLATILAGDVASEANAFNTSEAPALLQLLIDQLKTR